MDNTVEQQAREWIDSLSDPNGLHNGWRLQFITENTSLGSGSGSEHVSWSNPMATGKHPTRIRRFARGIPWALCHAAIKYLISLAPYEGIIYNGIPIPGKYRPTRTLWQRDEDISVAGEGQNKGASRGTYTLIQDLVEDGVDDLYTVGTQVNCSEEVVSTYVWDASEIQQLPEPEQGVTWSIAAISRGEDGLFNYVLIKRRAITQHMPPVTVACGKTGTSVVETWNNLYGSPGDFRDDLGNPVELPDPCEHGKGRTVKLQVTENDDCTFRAVAETTDTMEADADESCHITQFEHNHSVTDANQDDKLDFHVPAAHDGIITTHQSKANDDGTYDNTVKTDTELEVLSSKEAWRVTHKGTYHTVENTHVVEPEETPTDVGTSVTNEKTPGHLYNTQVSEFIKDTGRPIDEQCGKTQYQHDHMFRESKPGMDVDLPHVEEASGGVMVTRSQHLDEDGVRIDTEETKTELEVLSSKESWRVLQKGTYHTRVNTNVPNPEAAPGSGAIGSTVSNEKTPGKLYVTEVSEFVRGTGHIIDEQCGKTQFQHDHMTRESKPGLEVVLPHVEEASGGVIVTRSQHLDEEGVRIDTDETKTELPVERSRESWEIVRAGVRHTVVNTQVTDPLAPLEWSPENIGMTRMNDKTPGKLVTTTSVGLDRVNTPVEYFCTEHRLEHDDRVTKGDTELRDNHVLFTVGTILSQDSELQNDGSIVTTNSTREAKGWDSGIVEWANEREHVYMRVYRNQENFHTPDECPGYVKSDKSSSSCSFNINEFGLFDGSWTVHIYDDDNDGDVARVRTGGDPNTVRNYSDTQVSSPFWDAEHGKYLVTIITTTAKFIFKSVLTRSMDKLMDALMYNFSISHSGLSIGTEVHNVGDRYKLILIPSSIEDVQRVQTTEEIKVVAGAQQKLPDPDPGPPKK